MRTSLAVIGAGLAGLTAAQRLIRRGFAVQVFDKGRGAGGRMSTRREDRDGRNLFFDHGAQYFTVRDRRFAAQVATWEAQGLVAPWPQAGPQAYTGTPMMCAPLVDMAQAVGVQFGVRIDAVVRDGDGWQLVGEQGRFGPFDAVIVALPAEQAADLLHWPAPELAATAARQRSQPCWTTLVSLSAPLPGHAAVTRPKDPVLAWIADNSSKPGRTAESAWVLQSTPDWAADNLDLGREDAASAMMTAWQGVIGHDLPPAAFVRGHLWRYARSPGSGDGFLWSDDQRLGVCGDWLIGPRIEAAWLSGWRLAEIIRPVRPAP
ncbi:FAD dependent oxidoreductase family protein [Asticcacaulis biprosthecium C19]|uniref:FAD dependent oxidoreductase family protein n=1 Tax=Asticcacaulis biprosthecium C19 TaxID=715226 RepID=F4QHL1_9CAUL|nr:FAD-dependent oxidoreductase [Asticcacaulis biprosthecium]EGF92748.1 FAD dependent oxidoreductase family protein [Asticcacaulis biprosthecium C19]